MKRYIVFVLTIMTACSAVAGIVLPGGLPPDGSVPMTGDLDMGGNSLLNAGNVMLTDGSVPMTGDLDMGGNTISNAMFVGDGSGLTNLQVDAFTTHTGNVEIVGDLTIEGVGYFTDDLITDTDFHAGGRITSEGRRIVPYTGTPNLHSDGLRFTEDGVLSMMQRTFSQGGATAFASFSMFTNAATAGLGSTAYFGGVLLPDGRVAMVPQAEKSIGIFDPAANDFYRFTNAATAGLTNNAYFGGVLLPDGRVAMNPRRSETSVGIFDGNYAPMPKSTLLLPYFNKY